MDTYIAPITDTIIDTVSNQIKKKKNGPQFNFVSKYSDF